MHTPHWLHLGIIYIEPSTFQSFNLYLFPSLSGWQPDLCAADHRGVCPQTGHQAADKCPPESGVEGFSQRRGFHHDGIYLSHTHGAASPHGAKSQVQIHKPDKTFLFREDLKLFTKLHKSFWL